MHSVSLANGFYPWRAGIEDWLDCLVLHVVLVRLP